MELTEDQPNKKYVTEYKLFGRTTLIPYEYEFSFDVCGYDVAKKNHEFSKIQRKCNFFY